MTKEKLSLILHYFQITFSHRFGDFSENENNNKNMQFLFLLLLLVYVTKNTDGDISETEISWCQNRIFKRWHWWQNCRIFWYLDLDLYCAFGFFRIWIFLFGFFHLLLICVGNAAWRAWNTKPKGLPPRTSSRSRGLEGLRLLVLILHSCRQFRWNQIRPTGIFFEDKIQ